MNILEEIIACKKIEIDKSKERLSLDKLKNLIKQKDLKKRNFYQIIKSKVNKKQVALIAEIKKHHRQKVLLKLVLIILK